MLVLPQRRTPLLACDYIHAAAFAIELHDAVDQCEQRVVFPHSDAFAGVKPGSHLANQNIASRNRFSTVSFDSTPLCIGISSVAAGTLTFLMSHYRAPYQLVVKLLSAIDSYFYR